MHRRSTEPELATDQAGFASSCGTVGRSCLEVVWVKSSYSDVGEEQVCVEVADLHPHIGVRDSKNPTGPALLLPPSAWSPFLTHLRATSA